MVPANDEMPAREPRADPKPLVSVVMGAFNAEPYIRESLLSAVEQTYPALEIIVVDDGSTDRTGDIVAEIAATDPRIRLIRQANMGVAAARNRAIEAASGEFIAPLDADDLWAPTKIERQVQRLQAAGPDSGFAYCWWAWIDTAGSVLDRSPRWNVEGQVLEKLAEVNFTGCASVPLFRRSCVEAVGRYRVQLSHHGSCEDWDLALRIAERYEATAVGAVLVAYRRRPQSMSTEYTTMLRSVPQVTGPLAERQPSLSPSVVERSHGQFTLYLAGVAYWSGDYLQAFRLALRARPVTLGLAVFPHVARILARRGLGLDRARRPLSAINGDYDGCVPDRPLIPYDEIYARYWSRSVDGSDGR
jgi:glycosyltransferase involved in cell wall biosynthesis